MLLSISTTYQPATDLGFLLHKHPDRFQTIPLAIGQAHVFYPESSEQKTTVCLMLEIDPIDMVKKARHFTGKGFDLGQYVNDRPYVASSFMSVALSKSFSTAMNGKCKERPELVHVPMPFEVSIPVLPAPGGGEILIRKIFEPLGYTVELERHNLDEKFTTWGPGKYFSLTLVHTITLRELLSHLYVLIPVLDNKKHYFVSPDEIDKLISKGQTWLNRHPEKEQITRRYLIQVGSLVRQAISRLAEDELTGDAEESLEEDKEAIKRHETLHNKRLKLVVEQLVKTGAQTVIDLGCGEGKLIRLLLKQKQFKKITGMDVSYNDLIKAKDRLYWKELAPRQKERIEIFQGALTYRDKRLENYEAAAIVEVVEHLDPNRLKAFERVVFEFARPGTIVLTTPNKEYNVFYQNLKTDALRHADHRFEWTRQEFQNWARDVAKRNNYTVEFMPVGDEETNIGAPAQMGIFTYGN